MALDPATVQNIAGSQVTVAERWLKMYRTIHHLFLQTDFTNRDDFDFTLDQINLRMDAMEDSIDAMATQLATALEVITIWGMAHVHPTAAPGPPSPTVLPLIIEDPEYVTTPEAQSTFENVDARDEELQATGEPVVPAAADTAST